MKPPKTYQEQLEILASRGLTINNRAEAELCLSRINYYRISAYAIPFQNPRDTFIPGTTFEQICQLYEFDRQLRLLVSEALEVVEISLRTRAAYHFAHTYGEAGHEDANNFATPNKYFTHAGWLKHLHDDLDDSRETFVEHHKAKYAETFPGVPIWVAVEVMSLGTLSKFISGLKIKDQKALAAFFGCHAAYFSNWIHVFTCVRNICAHHSRLWNRNLSPSLRIPQPKYFIAPDGRTVSLDHWVNLLGNKTATIIFALCHVLEAIDKQAAISFSARMIELLNTNKPFADAPRHMGFPYTWQTHPLWKK